MEQITDLYNANTETIDSLSESMSQYSQVETPVDALVPKESTAQKTTQASQSRSVEDFETLTSLTKISSDIEVIEELRPINERQSLTLFEKAQLAHMRRQEMRETWKFRILSIITVILASILVTSFFIYKEVREIREILQNAEIYSSEVYKSTEQLKFILDLKKDINQISYFENNLIESAYAENNNTYVDGDFILQASIISKASEKEYPIELEIEKVSPTSYEISSNNTEQTLIPGSYELKIDMQKGSVSETKIQDFSWGVLVINTTKSVYQPGEEANIHMAVLDEFGEMVCDALVELEITSPSGKTTLLSTTNNSIVANPSCSSKRVVAEPDYESSLKVEEVGVYNLKLTATTHNDSYEIVDSFLSNEYVPFEIERITSTRIYPTNDYPVILRIKPDNDFSGIFTEKVPNVFKIKEPNTQLLSIFSENAAALADLYDNVEDSNEYKVISWEVNWEKNQTYYLVYAYDAPNNSPDYHTLGPAELRNNTTISNSIEFLEYRKWQIAVDAIGAFRVIEYYLSTGDFIGTTYDLTLEQELAENYFVLIRGAKVDASGSNADNDYARVYSVPDGAGELADSGSTTVIGLSRYVADHTWEGVVTVFECVADCDNSGFNLVDIVETSISTSSTSGTDTSTSWSDIDNVVLFGGFHGGGAEFEAAATASDGNAVQTRLYPTSTGTINWERNSSTALHAVTMTTFVVEWGSDWTVQHVNVSGSANGDGCDATGEYGTGTISSVARANTWVWGTGHSDGNGIGDSVSGTIITLGDGVTENTNETSVSYCGEYNHTKDLDIYTMTHSDLAVDYEFKADGDSTAEDLEIAVNSATDGQRFSWITNSCNGSGGAHPRDRFWARYTDNAEVTLSRGHVDQAFPAWVMGIDFNDVEASTAVTTQNHFRWRDDTTDINTSGGWLAAENSNSIGNFQRYTTYRLRFNISNEGTSAESSSRSYELQWGDLAGNSNCGQITTWTGVGNTNDEFNMKATTHIDPDGETTTAIMANSESYTFVSGEGRKTADTTGAIGPLNGESFTEIEYSFEAGDSAVTGKSYCFRVYDTSSSSTLDIYKQYPQITMDYKEIISGTVVGEAGTFESEENGGWTTITFNRSYTEPVVVGTTNTRVDNNALVFESRNVSSTQAEMRVCESDGHSATGCATHSSETVGYLVIDADAADSVDGIEAGTFDISGSIDSSTQTVNYSGTYTTAPVVFASVQTVDDTDPIEARVTVVGTSSFTAGICQQDGVDTCNSSHGTETVGWVAIDPTNIPFDQDADAGSVSHGGGDTWTSTGTFAITFSSTPVVIAKMNGNNGNQRAEISEATSVTTTSASVRFCEIDGPDTCDSHNSNPVAWLAVDEGTLTTGGGIISMEQFTYRFYQNEDDTDPSTPLTSENTAYAGVSDSEILRLRLSAQLGLTDIEANSVRYKIQYGEGQNCDSIVSWNDVGNISSSAIWRGYNNTTAVDGATITSSLLDGGTNILQSYVEENDSPSNPNSVDVGELAEWDWVIQNNNATSATRYCFRMVTDNDESLVYTSYPQVTTGISVSGTAYTDDDENTTLNGVDICVAANSSYDAKDCVATSSGVFTVSGIDAINGGEQLTVFVDGATNGNVVTIGDGNDITDLKIYQDHIITRYETGSSISITDMDAYDNDQNSADILFDAESGSPNTLSWESGTELYIPTGYNFAPNGNIDGHDLEIYGTYTADNNESINLDGTYKLNVGGTFEPSTSTLTFDATSGTELLITDGTGDIYNLVIDDGGGSFTLEIEDPLTVENNITITSGTLDVKSGENNQISIGGSWLNDDTFEARSGTVVFDGAQNSTLDSGCSNENTCTNADFYNLTIDKDEDAVIDLANTHLRVGNMLKVVKGVFNQNSLNVRSEGTDALVINDFGRYRNLSTGNITLGGNVVNDGEMTLNSNGAVCGQNDDINVTSTNTSSRDWSGEGGFRITDTTISYMSGSAVIYASSSTNAGNNGSNWHFIPCQSINLNSLDIEGININ